MSNVSRIAITLLCLAPGFSHAEPELRIGAGIDVIHKSGMAMGTVALGPFSFYAWDHNNYGAALAYGFGPRVGWNAAVGGILVRRTDDDLGTHLNLLLRGSYCWQKLCLSYAHMSHASGLGIERQKANSGLNFVFIEYRR
jgi:hypothetical protein